MEKARIQFAMRKTKPMNPEDVISKAFEKWGNNTAVSWSGGICSTAVLHLTLQANPKVKVIFNNTGVEYPETVKYIHQLTKEWKLNLIETKPKRTFWQVVEKYGFPMFRASKKAKAKNGKPNVQKPKCCLYLKEYPLREAIVKNGVKALLDGLRAGESRVRMYTIHDYGIIHYHKRLKVWKYHPIAFWTKDDVLNYLKRNSIPINPIYEKGIMRTGCMPCTGFKGWREQIAKTNPKMYRIIMEHLQPETKLLDDYMKKIEDDEVLAGCEIYDKKMRQTILEEWI